MNSQELTGQRDTPRLETPMKNNSVDKGLWECTSPAVSPSKLEKDKPKEV
jgi:hypothetical protein